MRILMSILFLITTTNAFSMVWPKKIEVVATGFHVKRGEYNPKQPDLNIVLQRKYNSSSQCQYEGDGAFMVFVAVYGTETTYQANLNFGQDSYALETSIEEPTKNSVTAEGKVKFGYLVQWNYADYGTSYDGEDFEQVGYVNSVTFTVLE